MGLVDGLLTVLAGGIAGGANAYDQELSADMQMKRQVQAQRDVLAAQLQARIDEANNPDLQNALVANAARLTAARQQGAQPQPVDMQTQSATNAMQRQALLGVRPDGMGVWTWDDTIGRPVIEASTGGLPPGPFTRGCFGLPSGPICY